MVEKIITLLPQSFLLVYKIIQLWSKSYCRLQLLSSDLNTKIILIENTGAGLEKTHLSELVRSTYFQQSGLIDWRYVDYWDSQTPI